MVRPPRLGGNRRVGVFASRSPQRPNFLGMSVVRLTDVICQSGKVFLELAGGDFLDGTPVIDLKPYLPYTDCIDNASGGYASKPPAVLQVQLDVACRQFCLTYQQKTGHDLLSLLEQLLAQDPRPAYQGNDGREYGMTLWDVNIRFRVTGQKVQVIALNVMEGGGVNSSS